MPDRLLPIAAVSLIALIACGPAKASGMTTTASVVARGKYLTIAADCEACHTDPKSGKVFAGGRPIDTPFGLLLAPNITPDRETGIGAWSDEEFVNSLTRGTGRNGTHLYPAMPFTSYTKMSTEDALAIRAYLNTMPAVRNSVQSNQLHFPFNVRALLIGWDALYFSEGPYRPDSTKSAAWNRGAYLVQGPMHCGTCHTPKTALGADDGDKKLQGYKLEGWFAPNITASKQVGLGSWSNAEIVSYLKTGHVRTAAASGPMAEEVALSSSKMTEADLGAVALYLKDQAGSDLAGQAAPPASSMAAGAAIYADECSACHTPNGGGIAGLFPSLRNSPSVRSADATSLIHVVLAGARSVATDGAPTAAAMPSFGWLLTDNEIASVTTYIRNSWGNHASPVADADVKSLRDDIGGKP